MSFVTTVWDYRQLSGKHLLLGKEAVWSAGCGSCGFCHPLGSEGSLPYFLHIWMTVSIYQRTPQNELFPLEEWFGGFTYMCLPCYYKSTLLLLQIHTALACLSSAHIVLPWCYSLCIDIIFHLGGHWWEVTCPAVALVLPFPSQICSSGPCF